MSSNQNYELVSTGKHNYNREMRRGYEFISEHFWKRFFERFMVPFAIVCVSLLTGDRKKELK